MVDWLPFRCILILYMLWRTLIVCVIIYLLFQYSVELKYYVCVFWRQKLYKVIWWTAHTNWDSLFLWCVVQVAPKPWPLTSQKLFLNPNPNLTNTMPKPYLNPKPNLTITKPNLNPNLTNTMPKTKYKFNLLINFI